MLPIHLEQFVRRIGWYQVLFNYPYDAGAFFAVVYGKSEFDDVSVGNPWAEQIATDFKRLGAVEGFEEISARAAHSPLDLLNDRELCQHIYQLSTSTVRAHMLDTFTQAFCAKSMVVGDVEHAASNIFRCDFIHADGCQCNYTASNQASVVHHAVRKHGTYDLARALTTANQCYFCGSFNTIPMVSSSVLICFLGLFLTANLLT